jgi:hypothetical protein
VNDFETTDMADGNKIARRSIRPFSDEYPAPQGENATGNDPKKTPSDRGDNKQHEKDMNSRNSSCSNSPPEALGAELRGLHGAGQETAKEGGFLLINHFQSLTDISVTKCLELAKSAKDRVEGRPVNFGKVMPGVYRSGYPQGSDYDYMKKLGLKTIV